MSGLETTEPLFGFCNIAEAHGLDFLKVVTIALRAHCRAARSKARLVSKSTHGYPSWRLEKRYAVAIWPVTGQGFQNTKWPAVLYSQ